MSISCPFKKEENPSSPIKTRYSSAEHMRLSVLQPGSPGDQLNFVLLGEVVSQTDASLKDQPERGHPSTSLFSLLAGAGKGTFGAILLPAMDTIIGPDSGLGDGSASFL